MGRRCRLSSLTTAKEINSAPFVRRLPACETDIHVGFSARALSPRGYLRKVRGARSLRPWWVEFTLCPATLPLPGKTTDLGLRHDCRPEEEADRKSLYIGCRSEREKRSRPCSIQRESEGASPEGKDRVLPLRGIKRDPSGDETALRMTIALSS